MGYYINAQGTIEMPRSLEDEALYALMMLNHDHGMKRGSGGRGGDPFENLWYSWMPARYHETVGSVQEVLELLGFSVTKTRKAGLNVYTLVYDNKTGQEEVFLNCLARFAQVTVDAVGEDGQRWRWANAKAGSALEYHEAVVRYVRSKTVEEMMETEKAQREEMRRMYA
jgi:hypothetical protein